MPLCVNVHIHQTGNVLIGLSWKTSVFISLPAFQEKFCLKLAEIAWVFLQANFRSISEGRFPDSPNLPADLASQEIWQIWRVRKSAFRNTPPNFCWQIFWKSEIQNTRKTFTRKGNYLAFFLQFPANIMLQGFCCKHTGRHTTVGWPLIQGRQADHAKQSKM